MAPLDSIDELDEQILRYLENDARGSLKKLADLLKRKTSTLYHRLQRMQNNKIILGYNVVFNPEIFHFWKISLVRIKIKSHNVKGFDEMFLNSFAKYLDEEYGDFLFITVLPAKREIFAIIPFESEKSYKEFLSSLKSNPYIDDITMDFFESKNIIKGYKIFNFHRCLIDRNHPSRTGNHEVQPDREGESEAEEKDIEIDTIDDESKVP